VDDLAAKLVKDIFSEEEKQKLRLIIDPILSKIADLLYNVYPACATINYKSNKAVVTCRDGTHESIDRLNVSSYRSAIRSCLLSNSELNRLLDELERETITPFESEMPIIMFLSFIIVFNVVLTMIMIGKNYSFEKIIYMNFFLILVLIFMYLFFAYLFAWWPINQSI
jgi:hypothetical protein